MEAHVVPGWNFKITVIQLLLWILIDREVYLEDADLKSLQSTYCFVFLSNVISRFPPNSQLLVIFDCFVKLGLKGNESFYYQVNHIHRIYFDLLRADDLCNLEDRHQSWVF